MEILDLLPAEVKALDEVLVVTILELERIKKYVSNDDKIELEKMEKEYKGIRNKLHIKYRL